MPQTHPAWLQAAGEPSADNCIVSRLIDKFARETPDRVFIRFENGEEWTWAQTRKIALDTCAALQARGMRPGDIVAAWAPNSAALTRAWFGANYGGGALAPINTSYRGRLLEHAISKTGARILIAHPELAKRLADISLGNLDRLILTGNVAGDLALPLEIEPCSALDGPGDRAVIADLSPSDTPVIIFTSGTTGPSKAVVTSYLQEWMTAQASYGYMTRDDRILVNLPMFHVGGISGIIAGLACGGSVALFESFNTRTFWADIRETGSTTCSGLLGALVTFLHKEPETAIDRHNPLRICTLSPISAETMAIATRFDFDYVSGFNMTEVSTPLITEINEQTLSSCGRARAGIECRIIGPDGSELPDGEAGELIMRPQNRYEFFKEYLGDPAATAEVWRDGWFHTGDLLRRDAEGRFYFVDRKKDAIRRRGENISSAEIEMEVSAHPDIREVAAYGVNCDEGEQEVMVCVSTKPGASINPHALIEFLIPRMAHFMVPRYVRVMAELPKTPTNKIQKAHLRSEGITGDAWDREAHGIKIKRERLSGA